jgi:cephalosporin-C deacetylase-like acetyl esterase
MKLSASFYNSISTKTTKVPWWLVILVAGSGLISQITAQSPVPIVIDGELNDSLWQSMTPAKLTAIEPGVPNSLGGEIRCGVMGGYLYLSARLPELTGRITARSIGINPNWEDGEDQIEVHISANLAPSDWVLRINPLGAYSMERKGQSVYPERVMVAARIREEEWSVEIAVPLFELRSSPASALRLSAERIRAMRPGSPEQRWRWPEQGPVASVAVIEAGPSEVVVPAFRPVQLGQTKPILKVGRRELLPPPNSKWNDPVWSDVASLELLRNEPHARLPRFPTEVKLLHDNRTLTVMARCNEPGAVLSNVRKRDGAVDQDDSFQVFLAGSGSAYVKIAINPSGYLLDAVGESGGPYKSRARLDWSASVEGTVEQGNGAWIARLDIPLDSVAKALGEAGIPQAWRLLLLRSRPSRSGEPKEISVLPVIQTDTPVCPARYQRMVLAGHDPGQVELPPAPVPGSALGSLDSRVFNTEQRKQMDLATMLDRHVRGRVRQILEREREAWTQVKTVADWERFREPRLRALADSLGEFPSRSGLDARIVKEFQGNGYRRQDLIYQSRPGLWVTANLYLPLESRTRVPGFIIVHSHHRPKSQGELQDMGILWARAGSAVLIMDQIGHGERIQNYPWNREAYHSRYVMGMQLYLAGESLMKWMVWDIMRGVDLLLERKEIDARQIILLGAVAGGGDPAAVTAALDPRITAVAPFNFGECTPETPRFLPEKNQWPLDLADPGWGDWESTRSLRRSVIDQFLPWMICASVAPRRFVYSFEMGWNVEDLPAWSRYRKVFGFYDAMDHLDEAHGFGPFPGPGECTNIGPAQRQTVYPELNRWFGIPIPSREPEDRRPEAELTVLSPAVAASLTMREVHVMAREAGQAKLEGVRRKLVQMPALQRREWIQNHWREKLGDIDPNRAPQATLHWKKSMSQFTVEAIALNVEPEILVPLLLLEPSGPRSPLPVVVAVSEGGKDRFLKNHSDGIESLLKAGVAVCLPDVRGTGETSPDPGRGPDSEEITLAATELMLGNTLLGARLKDFRSVIAWLAQRSEITPQRVGLWGDSQNPVNPPKFLLDELPGWQVGPEVENQAEPLGGLLALLGALYEDQVHAVVIKSGLISYLSILEDRFAYVPLDAVVPGVLDAGDVDDLAATLSPRPLLLDGLIDGRNRLVPETSLQTLLPAVREAYQGKSSVDLVIRERTGTPNLVQWLLAHL